MKLVQTCIACPEQYDVFDGEDYVGYLRLRYGIFTAKFIPTGEAVYIAKTDGDGVFAEAERDYHLVTALGAIKKEIIKGKTNKTRLQELLDWSSY